MNKRNGKSHEWENSEAWKRGQKVEKEFAKLLEFRDPNFKKANLEEQRQHFDYITFFGTIDVKSQNAWNKNYVWLEIKNVVGGNGWLCGQTDIIAFERDKYFLLVKRRRLLELVYEKCDLTKTVTDKLRALYKCYTRAKRKDLLTLVRWEDVLNLPHQKWNKL